MEDNIQPICLKCVKKRRDKAQQYILTNGLHIGDYAKIPLEKEHIWVIVTEIGIKTCNGILDNEPISSKYTIGEEVEFKIKDVEQIYLT